MSALATRITQWRPLTRPAQAREGSRLGAAGAIPWVLLSIAFGLLSASVADALARTGRSGGLALFWLALVVIMFPAAMCLTSNRPSAGERAAIVVAVGLGLYGVKVLRDPFVFTYGDELLHLPNLHSILATGRLFGANTILGISPRYPGLETMAALMVRVGGLSQYDAGIVLLAFARMVMLLALYVFYERVSGSARVAAVGALVYTATPTFLYFGAMFAYESLALPLATVALMALLRWARARDLASRRRWGALVIALGATIIVTHHVTSYFLALLLLTLCLVHVVLHERRTGPWILTAIVVLLTAAWLTLVAGRTVGYLSPVITRAISSVIKTLNHETGTRTLFANQGGQEQTNLPERVVAVVGILALAGGVLAGLALSWRRLSRQPVMTLMVLCAVLYVGTLPLRFVPAAWETASRAGEFLFLGVGVTVGIGTNWLLDRGSAGRLRRRVLIAVSVTFVFASGVIAGWPGSELLSQARRVVAQGRTLDPPQVVAATWSGRMLGPNERVYAQPADARFFNNNALQAAFEGPGPLNTPLMSGFVHRALRNNHITLAVTDRRKISSDLLGGFYFDVGSPPLAPAKGANKFQTPTTDRIFDSGPIVIYGVKSLW
jgi:hypothetical protein